MCRDLMNVQNLNASLPLFEALCLKLLFRGVRRDRPGDLGLVAG